MPRPGAILGVLDANAKAALDEAAKATLPIVRQEAPGGLGGAMTASVRKTQTGYRAVIQAPRGKRYGDARAAQVVRWVTRGTGVRRVGPGPKRPITSKRGVLGTMVLPGGRRVRTVKGQHPNPFVARAENRAQGPVERIMRQGAERAADDLKRL